MIANGTTTIGEIPDIADSVFERLGFTYEKKDTETTYVEYDFTIYRDGIRLEVDVFRLPKGVTALKLASDTTVHELATAIGLPVEVENSAGLRYFVRFAKPSPRPEIRLPKRVPLDFDARPTGKPYAVPLGVDKSGRHRWESLLYLKNTLVGGEPGAGKSTFVNSWLLTLTKHLAPEQLRLTLIDMKAVEMRPWAGFPHVQGDVVTEIEDVEAAVEILLDERERRKRLMKSAWAASLPEYNSGASEPLPVHLIVIDELADIGIHFGVKSHVFESMIRVANMGRSLGMFFLVATQRPDTTYINASLKATMNTRVALRAASVWDSKTIIDVTDAASISKRTPGRFKAVVGDGLETFQGFNLDRDELKAYCRANGQQRAETVDGMLDDAEVDLVRLALAHLDGAFTISKLYDLSDDLSKYAIEKTAKKLERRRLLTTPGLATEPRRVTPELAQLAGIEA